MLSARPVVQRVDLWLQIVESFILIYFINKIVSKKHPLNNGSQNTYAQLTFCLIFSEQIWTTNILSYTVKPEVLYIMINS
jgi:hypothetical protein